MKTGMLNEVVILLILLTSVTRGEPELPVWRWDCENGFCVKNQANTEGEESPARGLAACRIICADAAGLWPKPTGDIYLITELNEIDISIIYFKGNEQNTPITDLLAAAFNIFKDSIYSLVPNNYNNSNGAYLSINVEVADRNTTRLTWMTDESYSLNASEADDGKLLNVTITAENFFGVRHGLVTLGQLIVYDDISNEVITPNDFFVADKPAYPHRGIALDTARNYITVDTIKKVLRGMGASKLNVFHWHITDSQSFPYVSKSRPNLSKYGAYSPRKIYDNEAIMEIINYGKERGVRVIPEFDAPAHVGEGWQNTDLVTCFNWQEWQNYCNEPPCGQFDPTKSGVYDALEDIYRDMNEQFELDAFHIGGDEVYYACWNATESIVDWMKTEKNWGRTEEDFLELWKYFQKNALERFYKAIGREIPVILWSSDLTKPYNVSNYLPTDKYVIQFWSESTDLQIINLLAEGYKVIISNYDALYLDCGFSSWVSDGNNWCAPYVGWQKVYDNTPNSVAGSLKDQILGGEAALWAEEVDSTSVDSRLWPRSAALAEVLWTEPSTGWKDAETRFLAHRERLVNLDIAADALEPEWCVQNEGSCPLHKLT